ncbi:MAG: hypothetical protein LBB46_01670 [Coriobacteriaceae bacterium]|jgi:hypothetical protein|nr:hypothetical protein [Coriobacteriaceae bacterium]
MAGLSKDELLLIKEEHERIRRDRQEADFEEAVQEAEEQQEMILLLQQRAESFPHEARELGWQPIEVLKGGGLLGNRGVKAWPFMRINQGGYVKRYYIGKNGRIFSHRYQGRDRYQVVELTEFSCDEVNDIIDYIGTTEEDVGAFFRRILIDQNGFDNEEEDLFA